MSSIFKRKEPKQNRSKDTVDVILQSVVALVAEGRSDELTTGKIADRAGVSVGSVYQYFPGKSAIFTSLIEWHLKKELQLVKNTLGLIGEKTVSESISLFVDSIFEVRSKHVVLERTLLKFFSQFGDIEFLTRNDEMLIQEVEALLAQVAPSGLIHKGPTTAFVLTHAFRSVFLAATLEKPELYQDHDLREEMKRLLERYLTLA